MWVEEKPRAMICTTESSRIVWNTPALLKALLKTEKEECMSINIKVDSDPEGTGKHNDRNSSNQMLLSDIYC